MKRINQICHRGLVERGEKALEVTLSTLGNVRKVLNQRFLNKVIEVVESHFPKNQYLTLVSNTKGVYERHQAPPQKFVNRVFDLELAAITADSANLSRQALAKLRTALDEVLLQRRMTESSRWERVREFAVHKLALPIMKWVFAIIATVIAAIILYLLGIRG